MRISDFGGYHEIKSHVLPGFPYNTYLCTIPLDFQSVPAHWHDEVELVVIKKGRGTVAVNLEARVVQAGDIVLITPGQLHSIGQHEDNSMEYENILFRGEFLKSVSDDICSTGYLTPLFEGSIRCPVWIDRQWGAYEELASCICRIDEVCSRRGEAFQLAVKAYLYQFFYILFKENGVTKEIAPLKSLDKMKIVIRKIETDYQDRLTVSEMAEAIGFSTSHFMKYFKQGMGVSFIDYLNDYRLTMASRRLLASDYEILTVAMESGFTNVSYFNRLFKEKFGITPKNYREKGRKANETDASIRGRIL